VRHGFQICHDSVSFNILAHCKTDFGSGLAECRSIYDIPDHYHAVLFVLDFDPHGRFARYRRLDTDAASFHIQCDIIGQISDPANFYSYVRVHFIAGYRRTLGHIGDLRVYIETVKSILQLRCFSPQVALTVHALPASGRAFMEQIDRREFVSSRCRHRYIKIFFLQSALRSFGLRQLRFCRLRRKSTDDHRRIAEFLHFFRSSFQIVRSCSDACRRYCVIRIKHRFRCRFILVRIIKHIIISRGSVFRFVSFTHVAQDLFLSCAQSSLFCTPISKSFCIVKFHFHLLHADPLFHLPFFQLGFSVLSHLFLPELQFLQESGDRGVHYKKKTDHNDHDGHYIKSRDPDKLYDQTACSHPEGAAIVQHDPIAVMKCNVPQSIP